MSKKEKIRAAAFAIRKNLDFEELKYSDEMYGKEIFTDSVWFYVTECKENGEKWFNEKYSEYLKK